jgi:seryl-tRNA synthetase
MQNLPILKTTNLPSLNSSYGALDIVGNTVGRYFDYKRDTVMINHETEKVKAQANVMVKKIDAELTKSLDENEKSFKKEMKRLKTIAKELKSGTKNKNKIIKAMVNCSDPVRLKEYRLILANEHEVVLKKLNLLSSFEPNTKLLGGV